MKKKIILGVLALIIIGVGVGNWYLGHQVEKEISQQLESKLKKTNLDLKYKEIAANPMLQQTTLTDVTLTTNKDVRVTTNELVVSSGWKDLMKIAQQGEMNKLHKLGIDLKNIEVTSAVDQSQLNFNNLSLDFNGQVDIKELTTNNNLNELLKADQNLTVSLTDAKVDFPRLFDFLAIDSQLQQKLATVDNLDLQLKYNATEQQLNLANFKVATPVLTWENSGTWSYSSTSQKQALTDLELTSYSNQQKLAVDSKGLSWGQPDEYGQYQLDNLDLESEVSAASLKELPQGTINLSVENFAAEFAGRTRKQLEFMMAAMLFPARLEQIKLDQLDLNYEYDGEIIELTDSKFKNPLFAADLAAKLDVNQERFSQSQIKDLRLKLDDLSENTKQLVKQFEQQLGKSFKRDESGRVIVELTGSLHDPRLE